MSKIKKLLQNINQVHFIMQYKSNRAKYVFHRWRTIIKTTNTRWEEMQEILQIKVFIIVIYIGSLSNAQN